MQNALDVSLRSCALCIVDNRGKVYLERELRCEVEDIADCLEAFEQPIERVGFEAGAMSQHLFFGLQSSGFDVVCMEARQVSAALSCVDGSLFASTDLMIKPVRSSLVFGLLARRTWPLALMVSTNQVPFRNSNSKRSGQSKGRLGFRADKVPSPHWSCKLLCLRRSFKLFSLCMAHFGLGQPRSCGRFCLP
jgi:hypothetical protein